MTDQSTDQSTDGPDPIQELQHLQHRAKIAKANALRNNGRSLRDIAQQLHVAHSTIAAWIGPDRSNQPSLLSPDWSSLLNRRLLQLEQFPLEPNHYDIRHPDSLRILHLTALNLLHAHQQIRIALAVINRLAKQKLRPNPNLQHLPTHHTPPDQPTPPPVIRLTPNCGPNDPFWQSFNDDDVYSYDLSPNNPTP